MINVQQGYLFELLRTIPAQTGQPHFFRVARDSMTDFQMCPSGHCHQTFLWLPTVTMCGVSVPLSVECHCFARAGSLVARSLNPIRTFLPAQYGQPEPRLRITLLAQTGQPEPSTVLEDTADHFRPQPPSGAHKQGSRILQSSILRWQTKYVLCRSASGSFACCHM